MEQELEQATELYQVVTNFIMNNSGQIVAAIVTLIIGLFIAGRVAKLVLRLLTSRNIDITLSRFAASAVKTLIIVMVAIMALSKIGVSVTPFVAAIGALSLGAGLALQGMLSNYAAGISIIVTRPFVIGDTITVQGETGLVREVHLAYTMLTNEDAVEITIPNRHIVGEIIKNSHPDSIVEIDVVIAYDSDVGTAISAILTALKPVEGISESRDPQAGIDHFAQSGISIGVRFWAKTEVLFDTRYKANAAIYKALKGNKIEIALPQRQVQLLNESS